MSFLLISAADAAADDDDGDVSDDAAEWTRLVY